jgi:hypothetical protein
MSLSFHFREKLFSDWETAQGFLVAEFDYLFAGLVPVGPLIDSLQAQSFAQAGGYPPSMLLVSDASGVASFSSVYPTLLQFPSALTVTPGVLTTGLVNDFNPAGFDAAAQLRLSGGTATQLTGMHVTSALGGVYKLLVNAGITTISLMHRHASSQSVNQFVCPGGTTYALTANTAIWVWYDPIARGWQIIGK